MPFAVKANRGLVRTMSLSTTAAAAPNPWLRILGALEKKINRHSFDTWLKPTRFSHSNGKIAFVRVPTTQFRDIGDRYADLIQEALDGLEMGFEEAQFVTAEEDPSNVAAKDIAPENGFAPAPAHASSSSSRTNGAAVATGSQQARFDWDTAAHLIPKYTLTNLFIGNGTQ